MNPPRVAMHSVATAGGMRKHTEQLVSHLEIPCLVVTAEDSPAFSSHWRAVVLSAPVKRSRSLSGKAMLFVKHLHNLAKLYRAACRGGVSIIHIQEIEPLSLALVWPFLHARFQVVLSVHDVTPHQSYPGVLGTLQRQMITRLYRSADALCVFSQYGMRRLVDDHSVCPDMVHAMPLGLCEPLPINPPTRERVPECPTFLLFGSYRRNKGFEHLIDAFVALRERGVAARLRVAGRYSEIQVEATFRRLANAGFAGDLDFDNRFIQDDEIDGIMRLSDIMVLPYTRYESQSGVLFLAYAYNMPIVATRVGGLTEMLTSDGSGILAEPDNPLSLTDAMQEAIKRWDSVVRARLSERLRDRYSWERIAKVTTRVYESLCPRG